MSSAPHENTVEIRKILSNLESQTDIMDSLSKFRDIMLINKDDNLIRLVLQKVHGILHSSYNIEYIEILLDTIHVEETFDEVFRIILSFRDRSDIFRVLSRLRNNNELIIFKYFKELKNSPFPSDFFKEMDKRYIEILDEIE
ncbi:uncharacterized protein Eint_060010 [Encephalitozoon intestinalis ATCC 50506]|uniref:Uncharacterized protein n=1 Tax=Encephalitozoon intestinalis (strain ATCC 50506) TaxID=876142 RepID=E0S7D1_ENCIT|nr:uncharacterized protein Eint_060010 [Encephalitozoon intestinalis ATCC 50506]ADM11610.1 hypothetical protein Eint_060010 [Encephalitozoon intestinalis ATCC 50506]UTX45337.1 hypothetical protein GPK93_06g08880 [Encephalitozoon intestinalis]